MSIDATPPIEEIEATVDGAISPEQAIKLRHCLNNIDKLEKHKEEIEREISSAYLTLIMVPLP